MKKQKVVYAGLGASKHINEVLNKIPLFNPKEKGVIGLRRLVK